MNEPQTPVRQCVVGIPFLIGKLGARSSTAVELMPVTFLYTNVDELLQRCETAGVVLLQDPKELK